MKRSSALFAALVVLFVWIAGCSSGPTRQQRDQGRVHSAARRILRGSQPAAGKDRRRRLQPGIAADQFALFAKQARHQPTPDIDREQFEIMLTEIDKTVGAIPLGTGRTDCTATNPRLMRRWHRRTGNCRVPTRRRRSTACRRSTPALNTSRGPRHPHATRPRRLLPLRGGGRGTRRRWRCSRSTPPCSTGGSGWPAG